MTREEAIEWFKQNPFYHNGHEPFIMAIQALKAEPKRGRWICVNGWVHCSACGCEPPNESNIESDFCPNCGADMRGEMK